MKSAKERVCLVRFVNFIQVLMDQNLIATENLPASNDQNNMNMLKDMAGPTEPAAMISTRRNPEIADKENDHQNILKSSMSPAKFDQQSTSSKIVTFDLNKNYKSKETTTIISDDESATESEPDELVRCTSAQVLNSNEHSSIQTTLTGYATGDGVSKDNGSRPIVSEIIEDLDDLVGNIVKLEPIINSNSQQNDSSETPYLLDSEGEEYYLISTDEEQDGDYESEIEEIDDEKTNPSGPNVDQEATEINLIDADELDFRRYKSQFRLKSAFEKIFEKYGRDFEGQTDEIDMVTGEVIFLIGSC